MALNWSLSNTSRWLTVSGTSGTLNPGATATVQIGLNSSASNLLIIDYSGNVVFDNLSDGTTQNREFDLYVGNGGFETGDFSDWNLIGTTNLDFALAGDDVDVAGTNALDGEPDELFVHSGLYGAYLGEYPKDGSLSQAVPTTSGQQYLVSFWLTCVPYQDSTTPNDFTASWNDVTLYYQTNMAALDWTNLAYIVPAMSTSSTLEFDFDNVPGAFGLDDVTVQTVPAPVFQSASASGGTIMLTWSSIPSFSYQLQSASRLNNPAWTNVGPPIIASGTLSSASEPVSAGSPFYRVILLATP